MKPSKFSGSLEFTDPYTDILHVIKYEGVYEPACTRGHPDDWTPDESYLDLISLPEELEPYEKHIKELCWTDLAEGNDNDY